MSREVFVTGLGMISPAGVAAGPTWSALLAGCRAVRPITGVDLAGCRTTFAGLIGPFSPPPGIEGRACQLAVAAAAQALANAGLPRAQEFPPDRGRLRVVIGTSKPLYEAINSLGNYRANPAKTSIDLSEVFFRSLCDAPARRVASNLGATGGTHACVSACATGAHAIIRGAQMIQDGDADLVICGSTDTSLHRLWLAAYERMGGLAPEHPVRGPAFACRPFDRTREGFAIGEGAAILILESPESVRRRGGQPIARIAGYATGTDPAGLTQLSPDGAPLAHVIQLACSRARCEAKDIGAIVAHGTATPSNDLVETRAIRQALGSRVADIPIMSAKGAIGHLLGGAGAVETALAVLACRDRCCPGTATLIEPDPALGKLTLATEAFELTSPAVLKTSLGFGGHLAAIVVGPV